MITNITKHLGILRKLKFSLNRSNLEKMYLVYIRPLFEYACEVWDNCAIGSPFHCHACIFLVSHHFFSMICDWGIFFYSRDPRFMSLIDSPRFVKFSKMADFNLRES
jgi:hypothetical protein